MRQLLLLTAAHIPIGACIGILFLRSGRRRANESLGRV